MTCLVCGKSESANRFIVHEMMFGTREKFPYLPCKSCQSVQIEEVPSPEALSKYYPANYYSFSADPNSMPGDSIIKTLIRRPRDRYGMGVPDWLGWAISKLKPGSPSPLLRIMKAANVRLDKKVLDVGCGSNAALLRWMATRGFVNLLGADPFIAQDILTENGVKVVKRYIHELDAQFDLIMFNHSFEHVDDPTAVLTAAHDQLNRNGKCLIRIPTTSSDAWHSYGADWVQLDAPRHLFIPSRSGMKTLAESCGFIIEKVIDDSTSYQFVGSELCRLGIPVVEQRPEKYFSQAVLEDFRIKAEHLNAIHRGDQAAFVLGLI